MRLWLIVSLVAASPLLAQQIQPRNDAAIWMNRGLDAYRHGQFDQAASAFEKAGDLDPTNPNAHLYAGTAFVMLYVPGSDFPDNVMYFERAKTQFERTLDIIPNYPPAIASLAKLIFQQAQGNNDPVDKQRQLDEAREWYLKMTRFDARNKEGWYPLGAIAWMKCHPELAAARAQLGMKSDDPGPLTDAAVRKKLKDRIGQSIEDGITDLETALRIDPRYDEALDYMGRLIRDRADLRDTPAEYRQDIAEAGQWNQRLIETRKLKPPQFPVR